MNEDIGQARPGAGGFTLLELLIALTLILLVSLVSLGALRLGYRSAESADVRINAQERFRTSLNVIESQIQSAISVGWKEKEEDIEKVYFKGDQQSMKFSSNVSIWDGRRGYLTVSYRVAQGPDGKKRLTASENTVGSESLRETLLLDAMDEISFEYISAGIAEEGASGSLWIDTLRMPEKIRVQLAWSGRELSLLIPVRVRQGETASTGMPANPSNRTGAAPGAKATEREKGLP